MDPKRSEEQFRARLEAAGKLLSDLDLSEGLGHMLAFYAEQRLDGCDAEKDADMLLFQWDVYGSAGAESFQLSITRQFLLPARDEPSQFSLVFHYEPTDPLMDLDDGNLWCRMPVNLAAFRKQIEISVAYQEVAGHKATKVELVLSAD